MTMTLKRALDVLRVVTSRAMQGSETRDAYDCVVSHLTQSAQSVAAKDAEIDRLQSRLAAANALLRDIKDWDVRRSLQPAREETFFAIPHELRVRIAAHLQGSGDEA